MLSFLMIFFDLRRVSGPFVKELLRAGADPNSIWVREERLKGRLSAVSMMLEHSNRQKKIKYIFVWMSAIRISCGLWLIHLCPEVMGVANVPSVGRIGLYGQVSLRLKIFRFWKFEERATSLQLM